jgi:hypothetical protein
VRESVGAPLVQGYLLYRPMPLEALLEVVAENRKGHPADDEPSAEPGDLLAEIH